MHWFNLLVDGVVVAFVVGGLAWAGLTALMNYRVPPLQEKGRRPW